MKKKLKEKNYKFTINEILESLRNLNVFLDEDKYKPSYEQGQFLDVMNDITQIDLDSTYFKQTYFKKIIKKFLKKNLTTISCKRKNPKIA